MCKHPFIYGEGRGVQGLTPECANADKRVNIAVMKLLFLFAVFLHNEDDRGSPQPPITCGP